MQHLSPWKIEEVELPRGDQRQQARYRVPPSKIEFRLDIVSFSRGGIVIMTLKVKREFVIINYISQQAAGGSRVFVLRPQPPVQKRGKPPAPSLVW